MRSQVKRKMCDFLLAKLQIKQKTFSLTQSWKYQFENDGSV